MINYYKGTYVSSPVWLRVPEGKSLVFKASLSRYEGVCYFGDDTKGIAGPAGKFKHLTRRTFRRIRKGLLSPERETPSLAHADGSASFTTTVGGFASV